jgi:hypothetical protein
MVVGCLVVSLESRVAVAMARGEFVLTNLLADSQQTWRLSGRPERGRCIRREFESPRRSFFVRPRSGLTGPVWNCFAPVHKKTVSKPPCEPVQFRSGIVNRAGRKKEGGKKRRPVQKPQTGPKSRLDRST